MLFLDIALRGAAITVLMLLALLLWRAPIGQAGRVSILAVAVTQSAHLLLYVSTALGLPAWLVAYLGLLNAFLPVALTGLILTIFLDPPGRAWPWMASAGVVATASLLVPLSPVLGLVCALASLGLYAGLFLLALRTARDDLDDRRCRVRPIFAGAIAGLGIVLTALEATGGGAHQASQPVFSLLQSGGTLALALAFAAWILRPAADRWPGPADPAPPPRTTRQDTPDDALVDRIVEAMDGGIWREEGLTIGALAAHLSVPEHRLRRAINQGLGHRNFSSFINRNRIAAAQEALSDPERIGTTILQIAYEVGFASLGPFNRAFRAETGQSPSEFRRDNCGRAPADSSKSTPISANLH